MSLRAAREAAMQFLYGYDITHDSSDVTATAFGKKTWLGDDGAAYLTQVQELAPQSLERIDEILQANLFNWKLSRLSKVDLAILRLAVVEMELMGRNTPPKALITEMMEIARKYSGSRSSRFVNGVLAGYMEQKGIEGFHVDRSDQIRREKEAEEEEQRKLRELEAAKSKAAQEPALESLGISLDELESGSAPRKGGKSPHHPGGGKKAAPSGRVPQRKGPGAAARRPRSGQRQTGRGAASKPQGHSAGAAKGRSSWKKGPPRGGGRPTGSSPRTT